MLAALLVTTHGKLLGKLLGGSSGCGSSSLQLPRFNLLSMLCRPTWTSASTGYGGWMSGYAPGYGKSSGLW